MENEINQAISFIQGIRKIWWVFAIILLWIASVCAMAFFTFRYSRNIHDARESMETIEIINKTNVIIKEKVRRIEITNFIIDKKLIENEKTISNCYAILDSESLGNAIREYYK